MSEKYNNLKGEVWSHFQDMQHIFLATAERNQPRVRPVTLVHFNERFWVTTGTNNAKVNQIRKNNNIEFCLLLTTGEHTGYIRGAGEAIIVQDKGTKKILADNTPFFKDFWTDVDDPNYTLIEIIIRNVEYLKPGVFKAEKLSL